MARYKKYRYGGKQVPGMFQKGGDIPEGTTNTSLSPDESMINTVNVNRGDTTRSSRPNPMNVNQNDAFIFSEMQRLDAQNAAIMQAKQEAMQQQIVMQMKLQNDSLLQQNELLKTQIKKSDLINNARTTKQAPGASSSPKRYGGGNKKRAMFSQSGSSNMMKHGGSCLPGGRGSKKRK